MEYNTHLARLGLFDAKVPRYTSYPTAPQFGTGVDPGTFGSWIEAIPERGTISLYLHVPFCRRLCWFCACRTQGTTSTDPVIVYVETLKQEIALLGARLPPGVRLSRLHWGGGTPTMIPAPLIGELARAIFDAVPPAPGAEFSVEIDPNEIDVPRMEALAKAGMNRASIGVQDFDPLIQKAIGREQSFELTAQVAAMIRACGIDSLNADILFGLPYQTQGRIAQSVDLLLGLAPDRVALYGYAHVPWMSRRQQMIPAEAIPAARDRLALFETARTMFDAAGYAEIGIDHFAKATDGLARAQAAGSLRRNFQGYTDDTAPVLVGMGASSISRFPQGFAQNASGTADHTRAIRDGRFSTHRGHVFAGEDLLRGRIIEALMCDFHVSRAELLRDFDTTPARLDTLFAEATGRFGDFFRVDADGASIPDEGRPLARMIARTFDTYDAGTAQHSAAI